jgi:hypothetical protein
MKNPTCRIPQCHEPRCAQAGKLRFCAEHWRAELERREVTRLARLAARPQYNRGRAHREGARV